MQFKKSCIPLICRGPICFIVIVWPLHELVFFGNDHKLCQYFQAIRHKLFVFDALCDMLWDVDITRIVHNVNVQDMYLVGVCYRSLQGDMHFLQVKDLETMKIHVNTC